MQWIVIITNKHGEVLEHLVHDIADSGIQSIPINRRLEAGDTVWSGPYPAGRLRRMNGLVGSKFSVIVEL